MSARIVGIDTETTSLRADRRAWEIGLIERRPVVVKHPDGPDTTDVEDWPYRWFIRAEDLDLGNADPMALRIGRFYERHPDYAKPGGFTPAKGIRSVSEAEALLQVEALTRGAHLVGAVVSFDTEVLAARMRAHGICPSWHYHLIDVEALAVGYLAGSPAYGQSGAGSKRQETRQLIGPPWKSDDLSAALGITVSEEDRHTALGDAKWAMRIYDAVTGKMP